MAMELDLRPRRNGSIHGEAHDGAVVKASHALVRGTAVALGRPHTLSDNGMYDIRCYWAINVKPGSCQSNGRRNKQPVMQGSLAAASIIAGPSH
jgi:hypothetical protein